MLRPLRRALLLALAGLLVLASSAAAECAWVLWEISSPTGTNRDWSYDKIDAEATNNACKQRAEVAIGRRTVQGRVHGWTVTRGEANRRHPVCYGSARRTDSQDAFVVFEGRRSAIVGVPPHAVPNFAKSLIVVARRGFSDAARRWIVSRG